MLIHILIGLTKKDNQNLKLEYIKVLGFNKNGQKYLNNLKKNCLIPLTINKKSLIYQYELKCANIYNMVSKNNSEFEIINKPIRFE